MTKQNAHTLPDDPTLPGARALLDVSLMRPRAQDSFGTRSVISRLVIVRVDYEPGSRIRVLYRAEVGTNRHDLMAQVGHHAPDRKFVEKLSAQTRERIYARLPVTRLSDIEAHVTWAPIDFSLPQLCSGDVELADSVGMDDAGPTMRLSWTPGRRAVLRFPTGVMKLYADEREAELAKAALKNIQGLVATPAFVGSATDLGLVAQQVLTGRTHQRKDAGAVASDAMSLLRGLHSSSYSPQGNGVPLIDARSFLDAGAQAASRASFFCPELAGRLEAVRASLQASAPTSAEPVPCHGSFGPQNLLRDGKNLSVIDVDRFCLSAAERDVAEYAAASLTGAAHEAKDLPALLDACATAYGEPLPHLNWFVSAVLLNNIDAPIVRFDRHWHSHLEHLLELAEQYAR